MSTHKRFNFFFSDTVAIVADCCGSLVKSHVPVDGLYMVKTPPPPMPILRALTRLTHSRAAIAESTAEPLRFNMSLQTQRATT